MSSNPFPLTTERLLLEAGIIEDRSGRMVLTDEARHSIESRQTLRSARKSSKPYEPYKPRKRRDNLDIVELGKPSCVLKYPETKRERVNWPMLCERMKLRVFPLRVGARDALYCVDARGSVIASWYL